MSNRIKHYVAPIGKLIVFVVCILAFALPISLVQQVSFFKGLNTENSTLLLEVLLIFSIFGALFLLTKLYKPLTFGQLFIVKKNALNGFLKGTMFGIAIMGICVGLLSLMGYVSFTVGKISVSLVFFYVAYFFVVALFEELLFRTYALFIFAETYPVTLTIIINGLLFGLIHLLNPGFTWLAMLNVSLAGVLFSMFTLYYRNLSWAVGIHLGWNYAQGIIFGFNVSGTSTPSILKTRPIANGYLSGGEFGVEGSLICTIILLLIISYFMMRFKMKSTTINKKGPSYQ